MSESPEHSSRFLAAACEREGVQPGTLVIHSDNGGPMKGATLLATLQALGVATSFSRPSVSNDNPFSESLFCTMKYRPAFPDGPFKSIEDACAWMTAFVRWYNAEHRHSGIRFVTPEERHSGREAALLEQRKVVYAKARAARPERWARSTQELGADRRGRPQSRTGRPGSSRRVRSPPQAATTLTLIGLLACIVNRRFERVRAQAAKRTKADAYPRSRSSWITGSKAA